ncbi:N-formylglutamate deformylase [Verminephrobacter eiseniae]|uniref:N-formylglutamate amidohydrolase n=1 Tax=Verminephrobacter eiseniae (strain EF01-2) TaxID=391735 RepID=A1WRY4_VEREI|nr:N-formylglutamate deformylase [Verminephrobacter eiseniae]ABM60391.1 N-formylglutamate amidohydrolase [Verminephrobacter eiseniae EF01-2]MCW5285867.1 N-formylglutamate deformylase [Verminephrobacter eiseniae]MCW5304165.1 N-formylglutamate deformylase [Verminephrobacter eiseniae]MCW8180634.1 N-formylglutamate deformylase [Verminephrobacter eiseniae]MCW8192091.1 N-formylglutamate deformylase [Verminephrobacter eiseniae]
MDSDVFHLHRGRIPLLISIPHRGTELPAEVRSGLSDVGLMLRDTDWHLETLYGFARDMGASMLGARLSRYAIDVNRAPDGVSLYPGQTTTGLCPTETFRGESLYRAGREPDAAEIERRREAYWQPYHDALRAELDRLRSIHGQVLLWEAHSIATVLPRLFEGELPDLNFGTNDGQSCAPDVLAAALGGVERTGGGFTQVVNGRFKGGYITRHFGRPEQGMHAIQLEMCQHLYMNEEPPFDYRPDVAEKVRSLLETMLGDALKQLAAKPRS